MKIYYCTCIEDTKYFFRDRGKLKKAKVAIFLYQFVEYVLKISNISGMAFYKSYKIFKIPSRLENIHFRSIFFFIIFF